MNRFSNGLALFSGAWNFLSEEIWLVVFPVFAMLGDGLWIGIFVRRFGFDRTVIDLKDLFSHGSASDFLRYYILVYLLALTTLFFNAALVSSIARILRGEEASVAAGLGDAVACLFDLMLWALLATTVNVIIDALKETSKGWLAFLYGALEVIWSVAIFFAVPIIVLEKKGPLQAVASSTELFKTTWGERLTSNFSFFFVYLLLAIPGVVLGMMAFGAQTIQMYLITAAYLLATTVVFMALRTIAQVGIYLSVVSPEIALEPLRNLAGSAFSTKVDP